MKAKPLKQLWVKTYKSLRGIFIEKIFLQISQK